MPTEMAPTSSQVLSTSLCDRCSGVTTVHHAFPTWVRARDITLRTLRSHSSKAS